MMIQDGATSENKKGLDVRAVKPSTTTTIDRRIKQT